VGGRDGAGGLGAAAGGRGAREIARASAHSRMGFHPTPRHDARVVGVAIGDPRGYQLLVESGAPRVSATDTIAHELTHIWQYTYLPEEWVSQLLPGERSEIYEGMATWASIQFIYLQGHTAYGNDQRAAFLRGDDEYGRGLARFLARYPMSTNRTVPRDTPYRHIPPL
jgi:hypothetical protein